LKDEATTIEEKMAKDCYDEVQEEVNKVQAARAPVGGLRMDFSINKDGKYVIAK